mgnify:CR=1 FL=1
MSEIELANAALMRRYYEEVFNRRNLAFMREHLHKDVVGHGPGVDRVVVRGSVRATHKPTGRAVRFFGITEYRIDGGLIREYWRAYDRHDLYEKQLGGWRP